MQPAAGPTEFLPSRGQDMQNAFVSPTNLDADKPTDEPTDRRSDAAHAADSACCVFGLSWLCRGLAFPALPVPATFLLLCTAHHVHVMRFICVALNASCVSAGTPSYLCGCQHIIEIDRQTKRYLVRRKSKDKWQEPLTLSRFELASLARQTAGSISTNKNESRSSLRCMQARRAVRIITKKSHNVASMLRHTHKLQQQKMKNSPPTPVAWYVLWPLQNHFSFDPLVVSYANVFHSHTF